MPWKTFILYTLIFILLKLQRLPLLENSHASPKNLLQNTRRFIFSKYKSTSIQTSDGVIRLNHVLPSQGIICFLYVLFTSDLEWKQKEKNLTTFLIVINWLLCIVFSTPKKWTIVRRIFLFFLSNFLGIPQMVVHI